MARRSRRGSSSRSNGRSSGSADNSGAPAAKASDRKARLRADMLVKLQGILPFIGALFLIFGILEYLFLLAPMDFMNPLWEIRLYGQLVDHVWGPLFGMALILVPLSNSISVASLKFRALVSWLAVVLAACYILLLPFGIVTTNRIYSGLKEVRATELNNRQVALGTAMDILYDLDSLESIKRFGSALDMKESFWAEPQLDKLKGELDAKYTQLHNERLENLLENYRKQVRSLAITSIKSTIGALVAAFGFFFLFRQTATYRTLLKQDAIGKGGAAGISRGTSSSDEDDDFASDEDERDSQA